MFKKKEFNLEKFRKKSEYDLIKQTKRDNFTFLNQKHCLKNQIVFAGDSITELFNINEVFSEFILNNDVIIYNRGISGDTSDRLSDRFYDNVLIIEPKLIVILIGINDLNINDNVDFVFSNIKKIISQTQDYLPDTKIVLQSVYPINNKMMPHLGKKMNDKILLLNRKLSEYCLNNNLMFVDIHSKLVDSNGLFNKALTYDGLHPNAQGFSVIGKELIKYLM